MPRNDRQTGWLWMVEIGDNDTGGRRSGAAPEERLDWKRKGCCCCRRRSSNPRCDSRSPFRVRRFMCMCDRSGHHPPLPAGGKERVRRATVAKTTTTATRAASNSGSRRQIGRERQKGQDKWRVGRPGGLQGTILLVLSTPTPARWRRRFDRAPET
jgi:hypothetical protein